ncbi:hypothetical protein ACV6EB_04155 [Enterococcus faecium]|uniref:hypothetical protein n=1 Tax=Enterococcus faecium TaxID=1352 RepID=UPI0034E94794
MPQFLPMLFEYSVGVIISVAFSFFAICVGPKPDTHISKICRTTFAAARQLSTPLDPQDFSYSRMAGLW